MRRAAPQEISHPDYFRTIFIGLGPAVGLGLGRFAYALLLPAMQQDLGWNYLQSGWINTANALGYLAGALTAPLVSRAGSLCTTYRLGVAAMGPILLLTALSEDFAILTLLRVLAGIAGAFAFVGGGALVAASAPPGSRRTGFRLATYYSGAGIGIMLSGAVVPQLLARLGSGAWPAAWAALGLLALPLGAAAWMAAGRLSPQSAASARQPARFSMWRAGPILVAYALYGIGSIGYMTFMFSLLAGPDASPDALSLFWCLLGLAALTAPWLWQRLLALHGGGRAFAALTGLNALGAALPLIVPGTGGAAASAVIFGTTFFTVTAATTLYVHRNADGSDYAAAIGAFTVVFGLGQAAGPIVVGSVAEMSGSLAGGLTAGALLLFISAALGAAQKDRNPERQAD